MTSSSEGNLSSYSDDALDNLHRGPGMRCAYSRRYSSTCEESSDSRTESFDNRIYEAENAVDDECVEVTNRSDPKADEDIICERPMLPQDGNQKYLLEQIKIQMQTQFDGLKDTLLKELGEIKDTQRTLQQDLMRLKGSGGDGDVMALNYEPFQRRAQYAVRPLSTAGTQTNFSVETQTPNSESWVVKPDADIVITSL
ncbi:uncharacterized protein LOC124140522 isoform X3 [Haliotis rufescens]|uniref:uncharacterized protein LOC124140522 isoform X3 n=1 Tax=Haliotis rufescens TaxID=6454 RepID=UPI00201EBB21|nr:uncharacterized protein LOC124140522 isoform X3 [Haliotis rufescens]